jgi:hypothetical protein
MFQWFRRPKKPYDENQILNDGLKFALEFGSNWLQPIQSRLAKRYPELTESELDNFNSQCQAAMAAGHEQVYTSFEQFGIEAFFELFAASYYQQYPWVNEKNLKRIFSQGMYYAYKNLGC